LVWLYKYKKKKIILISVLVKKENGRMDKNEK